MVIYHLILNILNGYVKCYVYNGSIGILNNTSTFYSLTRMIKSSFSTNEQFIQYFKTLDFKNIYQELSNECVSYKVAISLINSYLKKINMTNSEKAIEYLTDVFSFRKEFDLNAIKEHFETYNNLEDGQTKDKYYNIDITYKEIP